jgi:sugar/nucleoside kinase (ribokinase family)
MEYIIVFIIGFALGWFVQSWIGAQAFYNILKDLNVPDDKIMALAEKDGVDVSKYSTEETVETKSVGINVEKHSGRLYAYRSSDNEFLCYADSPEELFKEVLKKFQIEKVHISVEQGAEHVRDYIDGLEQA